MERIAAEVDLRRFCQMAADTSPDGPWLETRLDALRSAVQTWYDYFGPGTGGQFHIVLDDDNYEHHHIQWCMNDYGTHPCWGEIDPGPEAVRLMGEALLSFTEEQLEVLAWCDWGGIHR